MTFRRKGSTKTLPGTARGGWTKVVCIMPDGLYNEMQTAIEQEGYLNKMEFLRAALSEYIKKSRYKR